MILVTLRQAIIDGVQALAPSLKEVKNHGGRFDLDAIKAVAARTPSARVCCLGVRNLTFEGSVCKGDTLWGVFVVAGDQVEAKRDGVVLSLVGTIAPGLPDNCWGMDAEVDGARQVRADNLHTATLEKNGIALWALTFSHQVDFNRVDPAGLDDFLRAYIDYDLAPTDGTVDASDQIDLPSGDTP